MDGNDDRSRDAASRRGELDRMAREATDATFASDAAPASEEASAPHDAAARARVPGVLTGEIGPKGAVSARHRELSRTQRDRHGEVPSGGIAPGSARILLLPILALGVGLLILAVILGWLLA